MRLLATDTPITPESAVLAGFSVTPFLKRLEGVPMWLNPALLPPHEAGGAEYAVWVSETQKLNDPKIIFGFVADIEGKGIHLWRQGECILAVVGDENAEVPVCILCVVGE